MSEKEIILYCDCCQEPIYVGNWWAEYIRTKTVVCKSCDASLIQLIDLTDEFFE